MTPNGHSRRTAFTLVELLVVIGIIALLIAILLPVLIKARKAARNTQDLSNIHQVAIAILNYSIEWKHMPPGDAPGNRYPLPWMSTPAWTQLTTKYRIPRVAYGCNSLHTSQDVADRLMSTVGLYSTNYLNQNITVTGWNYFGGRNENGTGSQRQYIVQGTTTRRPYHCPRSFSDKSATTKVLLTCLNYDAATPKQNWESVAPHIKSVDTWIIPPNGIWKKPDGLHVALLDCSVSFVRFSDMTAMVNSWLDYSYVPNQ